ncbi:MAG TPA: hypothetical protein EYN30_00320, partial [Candidatus Poseidoniales archaeon]|nr:hypothetical protein [Candidatus Poseidoniales archaeon]
MSDEFTVHSGALKIRIHCIQDDIDDDDRDTLRIVIEVTNEGAQTVSGIVSRMRTMEGGKAEPHESASEIQAGTRQDYSYFVNPDSGAWLFKLEYQSSAGGQIVELGPHPSDLRIVESFRKPIQSDGKGSAVGGSIFDAAFGSALVDFGTEAEPAVAVAAAPTTDPLASAFSAEVPIQEPVATPPASNLLAPAHAPISAPIPTPAQEPEPPAAPSGPPPVMNPPLTMEKPEISSPEPLPTPVPIQEEALVNQMPSSPIPPGPMPPGMMPQGMMPPGPMPPG